MTHFLLPDPCLACARNPASRHSGDSPLGLCVPCRGRLHDLSGASLCAGCAAVLPAAGLPSGFLCGACRGAPRAFDSLVAGFAYAPPFDAVVTGLKFRRLEYLGEALADALWQRFAGAVREHDVVVAVPLHWRRHLTRGFNQAEAIARPLARRAGLRLAAGLRRRRATAAQAELPREERLRNLRRAFAAGGGAVRGARVLLVDDVVTTGATVEGAARALLEGGAASVTVLAAARTLEEGGGGRPAGGR